LSSADFQRLRWTRHVVRIVFPPIHKKKVMGGYFGGKRPLGKPRNRWEDAVWRDAADLL